MNNIVNPYIELKTIEEVELFANTNHTIAENNEFLGNFKIEIPQYVEYNTKNRLIAFFSDVEEYSAEYKKFIENAKTISYRSELRIALVKDVEIIKHFKMLYDGLWFNTHSMNSLVIKRGERTMFLDLSLMNEMLDNFMIYNTIPLIDELSLNNNKIVAQITTPLAVFYIDSIFHTPSFSQHLQILEHLAKQYLGYYVFLYIDGNTRTATKEKLGFSKESL